MSLTFKDAIIKDYAVASKVATDHIATEEEEEEEGEEKEEEEEEELFEIDLEVVNNIPPPHYWELSYFTTAATGNALLANCLLPIADVSSAVPAAANACDHAFSSPPPAGSFLVVDSMPGKLMGVIPTTFNGFGFQELLQGKKA